MKSIAFGAALFAGVMFTTTGVSAQTAPTYKAARDFSYLNGKGVWSYAYGLAGQVASLTPFSASLVDQCFQPVDGSDCFFDADALVATNVIGKTYVLSAPNSSSVIPGDALRLHPRSDNKDVLVIFTVPKNGSYRMEGFFEILDNRPSGVAPKIFVNAKDLTRKAFASKTDVVLTGGSNPAELAVGEKRSFSLTRDLKKGQLVQFAVGANGDFRYDSTGFDVKITPVASN